MNSNVLFAVELSDPQVIAGLVMVIVAAVVWFAYTMIKQMGVRSADERLDRFRGAATSTGERSGAQGERLQELLERAATPLSKPLTPQSEAEQSELKIRLANGGWRNENAVPVYLGIRLFCLLFGIVLATVTILPAFGLNKDGMMWSFIVAGIFFYIPQIFVWWRVSRRQEQVFLGLPDALDLMVVCVEAGLGLDAAMRKVCEEMGYTFPIISEEFSICNFQLQMGRPRREVLHDLGVRTGVDDMKALSAILIQADRFGSSIAQALRVQSDSMRLRRKQLAEERAAKTAVQLIIPLVLFIFPAVFIVLVGPAACRIMDTLMKTGG